MVPSKRSLVLKEFKLAVAGGVAGFGGEGGRFLFGHRFEGAHGCGR